jgi:hypothetical protein
MQSTVRPMTEQEVEQLTALAAAVFRAPSWIAALVAGTGMWLALLFAATFVLPRPSPAAGMWSIHILLVVCLSGAFLFFRRRSRAAYDRDLAVLRARYADDLRALQLEEWRVRIVDALQVEEVDDEGAQFFLELEDGRILFVMGQYLWDADDESPQFPNRELLITRLPHSGDIFDMECVGEYFPPSAERAPFTGQEYADERVPQDGQILPGPLSRYMVERDMEDEEHRRR